MHFDFGSFQHLAEMLPVAYVPNQILTDTFASCPLSAQLCGGHLRGRGLSSRNYYLLGGKLNMGQFALS